MSSNKQIEMVAKENETPESGRTEGQVITLRDIFEFILYNWYWFAISAVLFVAVGVVYALSRPSVYKSSSSVLIDERYNRSSNSDLSGFMPTNMMYRMHDGVEDELFVMGSYSIMEQVVNDLKANIVYSVKQGISHRYITEAEAPMLVVADTVRCVFSLKITPEADDRFSAEMEYKLPGDRTSTELTVTQQYGEQLPRRQAFSVSSPMANLVRLKCFR